MKERPARAAEHAYEGTRLLRESRRGESAASALRALVGTTIQSTQPWRILRIAERIALHGGTDRRAVAVLAGRIVRVHTVLLAAMLREQAGGGRGPLQVTTLSAEELRGDEQGHEIGQTPNGEDAYAVAALGTAV